MDAAFELNFRIHNKAYELKPTTFFNNELITILGKRLAIALLVATIYFLSRINSDTKY